MPLGRRLLAGRWPLIWGAVALGGPQHRDADPLQPPLGRDGGLRACGLEDRRRARLTDSVFWLYWSRPGYTEQLEGSIFAEATSVMDMAIVLGAALAAAASRSFRLTLGGGFRPWTGAVLGGLLMGYGARLSNGCNISAYFSSLAAGKRLGWLWLIVALAGCWIGLRLARCSASAAMRRRKARAADRIGFPTGC